MVIGTVKVTIHAPWVHSLKEKRMVVKSLCAKVRNKFNATIAEVDAQDVHQTIVLGFACVTSDSAHADSICDAIINFIESNTEGILQGIEREIL